MRTWPDKNGSAIGRFLRQHTSTVGSFPDAAVDKGKIGNYKTSFEIQQEELNSLP